ncbi:DUF4347 domain-containing protein [Nisaea sediminum]|uniref:DUF4347 domain-containing protein n=1 Tax=Nisaea sediminum TaxID=2775867 RepID=UPI001867BD00|nr:DUF4347 domain-containing protein [Nisaea sediminum]
MSRTVAAPSCGSAGKRYGIATPSSVSARQSENGLIATGRSVAIVDPRAVADRGSPRQLFPAADLRFIDPSRDGLRQIAEILGSFGPLDALYIMAHGAPGQIQLGAFPIDAAALASAADTVGAIRARLAGADVRLIACESGKGRTGRAFLEALACSFGAPVSAFEDRVGAGNDGGRLYVAGGQMRHMPGVTRGALASHPGALGTNFNAPSSSGSSSTLNSFGQIWADENPGDADAIRLGSSVTSIDLTTGVTITSSAANYSASSSTVTISSSTAQTITVSSGAKFTIGKTGESGQTFVISAKITGAGGVASNNATLTLSGSNDFSGGLTITGGGSASVSTAGALGSGTITLDNGTLVKTGNNVTSANAFTVGSGGGTIKVDENLFFHNGTISDGSAGYALTKSGDGTALIQGVSTDFTGTVNITGGTLVLNASDADSALAKATFNPTTGTLQTSSEETIGGLKGSGSVALPAGNLTINQSADTTFSGVISGSRGVIKSGDGTLVLTGSNTYSGSDGTTVSGGTLVVNGSIGNTNAVKVESGGKLAGNGTVTGSLSLKDGAQFGRAGEVDGGLTVNGNKTIGVAGGSTTTFHVDVKTDGNGSFTYDVLKGGGTYTISDATLTVASDGSTKQGDVLTVIDNTGTGAITGTFTDLAEGATFSSGGRTYKISYVGGTGNDVTLTDFVAPATGSGSSSGGSSGSGLTVTNQSTADTAGTATSRTLVNSSGGKATGALVENTGNGNLVTATLPSGVSLTNRGTSSAEVSSTASTTLTGEIRSTEPSSTDQSFLDGHGQTFLAKNSGMSMDIRSISFSSTGTEAQTVQITGESTNGGEAFVIDTGGLPVGSTLQIDNIEFAAIVGNATVTGGAGQNYVVGDDATQFISCGDEDDTLAGGGGNDTVGSGWGEDIVYGNQGTDYVFGGGGMDTLYGGQDTDTVFGGNDNDVLYGNKGADTLSGGENADLLFGGQDNDIVYGNTGNDSLSGNFGDDTLYGGQGNDLISGSEGNDFIAGNRGDDTLVGGDGADSFIFEFGGGNDTVADFTAGTDALVLRSGLTVASGTETAGNTVVTFSDGGTVTVIGVSKTDLAASTGWEFG